jgi:phosphocarrier protein
VAAEASGRVLLTHAVGLHARPCVKLTKLARTFVATIELAADAAGPWVDAKSIVRVMAAKVPQHATLHFRASGEDAGEAVEALVRLVRDDFADGENSPVRGDGRSA